ncbi:radical SAM methylthiotransferase, MiaB/RimO family protein [Orientia chuto str. Dubai]|uniref:tRNA (N(6)-L-threonylcarbamoyladenosine(37)-C(2))-methylthiotransferase n=1 Tax=Orientia chuto str. Dubai TaxID=1359168 RepID=A0A0F3MIK8_9RICK|nr:tRNA (N(6)-L-threonylcarbamoyladenosine(37)-C(2))-methylthiotransferase MtaB [Candidatus Orientia mediorientalis]KJV55506.1 radical SAM methylthiotransferase, MiaB/RimO family protein [Orientia chuto str. Dubai]
MNEDKVSTYNNKVITFGCRLNAYESEIIKQNLKITNLDNVIVFNTCTVTQEAERQAKQAIRKAKRENPNVRIIVTGCAAQNNPALFSQMSQVDKILGNKEKLYSEFYQFDENKIQVNDIMSIKETASHMISNFDGKTRAFIQVQNGCNHRCTFCIIPYARGNSRSVPIGLITQQIQLLVDQGYKEIVFTGIDLTAYGADLPGSPTLAQMIKRVLMLVPALPRVRLSSIDIAEIDQELFQLMTSEPRLMPHFHISLQAGDNMILKRMKRRHTREQIVEFCHKLRQIIPDVSFGADIIAGFPTETEDMFNNSLHLITETGLQYLHVFPYSERENTPASKMPKVKKYIRKKRAQLLRDEGKKQLHLFFQQQVGKIVKVLTEKEQFGHSENFIPTYITTKQKIGEIVNVKLTNINNDNMIGEIVN